MQDLVLVGGGHSHVAVLKQFGRRPLRDVRLTLISRGVDTPYSGMLPGLIAGHYAHADAHIDLRRLAQFAGARACFDEAVGLDLARRRVRCRDGSQVPYDLLSIDIGSTPNASVPGAAEHAIPVKPIDRFLRHWDALRQHVLARPGPTRIAIVGGGAGGVELLLSVQFALETMLAAQGGSPRRPELQLFAGSSTILPSHNGRVQAIFERVFRERGVRVHTGRRIASVEEGRLRDEAGVIHEADEILWTTEARAAGWLRESGLSTDEDGFVRVGDTLQSVSHPEVFAAGDVASLVGARLEKSGVYAVREGRILAMNLPRAATGRPLVRYRPQRQFLGLITTGDRYAIASRGRFALQGAWVWRWKDAIDRRFMRKYKDLPLTGGRASSALGVLLGVLFTACISLGCASGGAWPRVIPVSGQTAGGPARGEWIGTYDEAVASIASIMGGQLGLPPLQASLYFYPDREALGMALQAEGYTPEFARQTAETLTAVSGFKRVLINDRAMEDVGWLFRVALLAHEMTHTLQYDFAGGKRGTSDQWLREGFAEWVEVEVLVRLGFTTRLDARRVLRNRIRDAGVNRWPPLSGMVTFPQWVDLAQRFGQESLYGYAMLAAEYLVERHGLPAALEYFRLFAASDDRLGNFRSAFGQDVAEFERAFNAQLAAMLR